MKNGIERSFFGVFSDPEAMARAIGGLDPGAPGPRSVRGGAADFHAVLARAMLGEVSLGVGRFAQGAPQRAELSDTHTFMFATEPGLVRRVSGRTLGGNRIIHFRPYAETVATSPSGMAWAFGILLVPGEVLATHAPALAGFDLADPSQNDRMFLVPADAMTRLIALMNDAARIARDVPWIIEAEEPARALAGTILEALLLGLSQGELRHHRGAPERHRQIVARFEQLLHERPEDMLSLAAICAALGVAERTLNLACQQFLGQSAVSYARGRRLDLVRLTLLSSDPTTTQVTSVAMRYGFWELGRFAGAYRLRFGERPSETLRRGG
ncbi:helix-turn-helix domain-containing protein [Sphingosinicella sp. CPCC 101087]|uniref:AraC family transcriptional regulator n=1 Tax=Sphingosinicella sp. CPCC 101087 TaxID=2497754 RepID=UPI00197CC804|nr:helix-turn-helix domain-containing protein [Sphingosinicella sp. CPCC 101087]